MWRMFKSMESSYVSVGMYLRKRKWMCVYIYIRKVCRVFTWNECQGGSFIFKECTWERECVCLYIMQRSVTFSSRFHLVCMICTRSCSLLINTAGSTMSFLAVAMLQQLLLLSLNKSTTSSCTWTLLPILGSENFCAMRERKSWRAIDRGTWRTMMLSTS